MAPRSPTLCQFIPMKERVADVKFDPLVWLGAKIGMRTKDNDGREQL
ncbi:MAG: succinate dehydrogenase subunit [Marmoricola sp.]|nr:succinate dehydrogenase subunit [Marmoricola sp.]